MIDNRLLNSLNIASNILFCLIEKKSIHLAPVFKTKMNQGVILGGSPLVGTLVLFIGNAISGRGYETLGISERLTVPRNENLKEAQNLL